MYKVTTKNVLVSFYGEEELIEAKDFLWSDVDKLELDNMPRKISCATGDNRAKMVADDTLELIVGLLLDKLPTYAARNLDRIPVIKVEEHEVFCISKKVEVMEQKLAALDAIKFTELSGKIEEAVLRLAADHNTMHDVLDRWPQ